MVSSHSAVELFKPRLRTRLEPQRLGETTYRFIDDSAWEACEAYRGLLNRWLLGFPLYDRGELIRRIRTAKNDFNYHAATLEIVTSALLHGLGFQVDPHPQLVDQQTTPDFLVSDAIAGRAGFVEVTTIGASGDDIASGNRQMPIYKALDKTKMPRGCVLGFKLLVTGRVSPPLKQLCRDVQDWVDREAASASAAPLSRTFEHDDWAVELELIQTGSENTYQNAIHITGPYTGWLSTIQDIRYALSEKSRRYGILDRSYIIVVGDTHGRLWGSKNIASDLSQAMFGDEVVRWSGNGPASLDRKPNGFWLGSDGAIRRHVSGVIFFPDVGIWGLRNELHQPVLVVNPWATFPVPASMRRLKRIEIEDGLWSLLDGSQVADLIGLPAIWPPPREFPPALTARGLAPTSE